MVILGRPADLQAQPDCLRDTNPQAFKQYIFFEIVLKTLPPFLFFILGTVRYATIKDYAVGHCKYSNFFKAKVGISALVGTFDLIQAIIIFITPPTAANAGVINVCGLGWLGLFYIFWALAWFYGCWLMAFEYRRLLSEVWYANQLFWVLNLLLQTLSLSLLYNEAKDVSYIVAVNGVNITANLILVILMLKTEKRTLQNRRPEYNFLGDTPTQKRRALIEDASSSSPKGPFFRVKIKRQIQGNAYYTLQITCSDETSSSYKITKQYEDFRRLQTTLEQVAAKQNSLFQNSAKLEYSESHYMMQRPTFAVRAPVLDDAKKSFVM